MCKGRVSRRGVEKELSGVLVLFTGNLRDPSHGILIFRCWKSLDPCLTCLSCSLGHLVQAAAVKAFLGIPQRTYDRNVFLAGVSAAFHPSILKLKNKAAGFPCCQALDFSPAPCPG